MGGLDFCPVVCRIQAIEALLHNRRKRYTDRVQAHVLDAIEAVVARATTVQPLGDNEPD